MKEYKVISPSIGLRKRSEKLEELLNKHALESWDISFVVFEREKNR